MDHSVMNSALDQLRAIISRLEHQYRSVPSSVNWEQQQGQLKQLLEKTHQLGSLLKDQTESTAKSWIFQADRLWNEIKGGLQKLSHDVKSVMETNMPTIKEPVVMMFDDDWQKQFNSPDWQSYFRTRPYLNEELWKDRLRQSPIDSRKWRQALDQASHATEWPFDSQGWFYTMYHEPLKTTTIHESPFEWASKFNLPTIVSTNAELPLASTSLFYGIVSLIYLFVLSKRVMKARNASLIYIGDGSREMIASMPMEMQKQMNTAQPIPNISQITSLYHNLHCLQTMTMILPLPLIVLTLLELNGLSPWVLHTAYLALLVSIGLFNEYAIMKKRGYGFVRFWSESIWTTIPLLVSGIGVYVFLESIVAAK